MVHERTCEVVRALTFGAIGGRGTGRSLLYRLVVLLQRHLRCPETKGMDERAIWV